MKSSESSEELKKRKTLVNGNKNGNNKFSKVEFRGHFLFLYEILFFTCKTINYTGNSFSFELFD